MRRTQAELEDLDDAIVAAVAADAPVSLRGVYYRVVSAGAVVHLGDPEIVAAEIIEAGGADFGRTTAAWLLLLAEEVGQ